MTNFRSLLVVFALTAGLVGCASSQPVTLRASPAGTQILKYDQGQQIFISRSVSSSVGLVLSTEAVQPGDSFDCQVSVANHSSNSFNFSTNNIMVQCEQKTIHVYHPEEALREKEKKTDFSSSKLAGISPTDLLILTPQMIDYYRRRNQELQNFSQNLLKAQTIVPNSTYSGIVRIAFPSCTDKLKLIIKTGGDVHRFEFETTIR